MIAKFIKSTKYALNGIYIGVKEERNVRIDIVAFIYVHLFSLFYDFNPNQREILVVICFNVLAFELMNTAVERAVDKPDDKHYMAAGYAKDTAAGGVLLAAIGAVVAGVMMFWDVAVFKEIFAFFTQNILYAAALAVSAIAAYLFITYDRFIKKQ